MKYEYALMIDLRGSWVRLEDPDQGFNLAISKYLDRPVWLLRWCSGQKCWIRCTALCGEYADPSDGRRYRPGPDGRLQEIQETSE